MSQHTTFFSRLPQVHTGMRMDLYKLPNTGEIRWILENMSRGKAPGPDGLPAEFFQAFWPAVGLFVTKVVEDAFREGVLPESITTGRIILPKVQGELENPSAWRPITLLNTSYKIITTTLKGH